MVSPFLTAPFKNVLFKHYFLVRPQTLKKVAITFHLIYNYNNIPPNPQLREIQKYRISGGFPLPAVNSAQLEKSSVPRRLRAPVPRRLETIAALEEMGNCGAAGRGRRGVRVDMSGSENPVCLKLGRGGGGGALGGTEEPGGDAPGQAGCPRKALLLAPPGGPGRAGQEREDQ